MENQSIPDLTFLQTVRVMNRVYKSVLLFAVLAGIILFLKGWLKVGFAVSIIAAFDFGRRYGFDKGFWAGLKYKKHPQEGQTHDERATR
jgi:hypothetical protein